MAAAAMCGIVGYVGTRDAVPVIVEGLRRLEYRGYDSAGVAVVCDGALARRRSVGKLGNLVESLRAEPLSGQFGLGHTRWATHGRPSEENAHPHEDCQGRVVVGRVPQGRLQRGVHVQHLAEVPGVGGAVDAAADHRGYQGVLLGAEVVGARLFPETLGERLRRSVGGGRCAIVKHGGRSFSRWGWWTGRGDARRDRAG